MSKTHKGALIFRISELLLYLENPRTIKELVHFLGIKKWEAVRHYIRMFKEAGYPIKSRERLMPGRGLNPKEYWIDCHGAVVLQTIKMIAKLRGM